MAAHTDEDVQTCIDWLYSAMHDDRQIPEMAENLLEDLIPRVTRRAKAEALREFAALTRGPSKDLRDVGTCLSIALDAEVLADMAEAGIETDR